MKSCNEIKELISLYIDGELNTGLKNEFESHMETCEDCRTELQELKEIVSLCGIIAEEELPENFKEQLHEKLLTVGEMDKGLTLVKGISRFNINKFARIGTSIAAVLLIAVMLKVLFPLSGVSDRAEKSTSMAENAVSGQQAQSNESKADDKAEAFDMQVADQYGGETNNSSVMLDEAAKENEAGSLRKAEKPDAKAAQESAPAEEPKVKAKAAAPEKKENNVEVKEPEKATMFTIMTTSAENAIRDTDITVKVEDPDAELDKIRSKTLEFGAEYRVVKATDGAGGNTDSKTTGLVFRMPYAQYQRFIDALRTVYGNEFVAMGDTNTINMDEQIKSYQERLNDLDKKISTLEAAGTASEDEEYAKLRAERETTQKDLEYLMRDISYISVNIRILAK